VHLGNINHCGAKSFDIIKIVIVSLVTNPFFRDIMCRVNMIPADAVVAFATTASAGMILTGIFHFVHYMG